MEHLWSPAGATGGNLWQMEHPRKPFKQADPQPVATHGNRFGAHGKEGVDGSSPSEGSAKSLHVGNSSFRSTCSSSILRYERFCAVTRAKGCATPLLDGADFNILGAAKLYDGRCRRAAALCRLASPAPRIRSSREVLAPNCALEQVKEPRRSRTLFR